MNSFHHGPIRNGLISAFVGSALTCGLLVLAASTTDNRAVAGEPEPRQWKPSIGNWHRWTDRNGLDWDAIDLAGIQGKENVTFLSRRAPEETAEHFRAVLFSEDTKVLPLPYNIGGKQEINAYWYDAISEEGPFIRLADHWGEYLVDLRRKTTAKMVRHKGLTFIGELRPGESGSHVSVSDYGTRFEVSMEGRPTMAAIGPLARDSGKIIGQIRGR